MVAPLPQILGRPWVAWGLSLLFWTFLGIFNVFQYYFYSQSTGQPFNLVGGIVIGLADWYLWALFTPLIFYLARRWPLDQGKWRYTLPLHFVVSLACGLGTVAYMVPMNQYFNIDPKIPPRTYWQNFHDIYVRYLVAYLWIYWAVLGVSHAISNYRKYRERETQALQLQTQLAQAQLQVLKMQLHPHFLFNTLNAVSALMHQDVELADQMLARLADLLRSTLETAGTQEVPLKQELEFVELYLEIEQARFGSRLRVRIDADPETMDAYVPNLILQPLVENAIRHGIAPRPGTGYLDIHATRSGDVLEVLVLDNGPGLLNDHQNRPREGVGLSNTRARLRQLYGEAHEFTLANRSGGGLAVTLRVPFRESPDDVQRTPAVAAGETDTSPVMSFRGIASSRSL